MIVNNNMGVGDPAHKVKKKLYLEFIKLLILMLLYQIYEYKIFLRPIDLTYY